MNHQQIDLVRKSFALVQPMAPQAAALFYDNLFAADPTLRSLFLIYIPVFTMTGFGATVLLPFTLRALHGTEFDYGVLAGMESVGLVLAHEQVYLESLPRVQHVE